MSTKKTIAMFAVLCLIALGLGYWVGQSREGSRDGNGGNPGGNKEGIKKEAVPKEPEYLKKGLVAYYPFNGNAKDESGNGHDGEVNGAVLTTDRHGKSGKAYSFDGVDDYIVFPDAMSLNPSAQISIGAWVKITSLGNRQSIITKPYTAASEPHYQYHLEIRNAGELYFALSIDGTRTYLETTNPVVQPNVWYFILATYDGQQLEISINGVDSETSTAASGNLDTYSMDTWLGKFWHTSPLFEGELDDIRIYNRTLSEAEVKALYDFEKPKAK